MRKFDAVKRRVAKKIKATGSNASLAIIRVDSSRIRQEIKREYDKVLRELTKARQQLDHFHQHDLPRFSRWISSQFGALLTELRETSRRIDECDRLLFEMEREVMFGGFSPGRAYQRVMRRRERPETSANEQRSSENEAKANHDPFASHSDQREQNAESEFEDFLGSRRSKKTGRHNRESISRPAASRLKELYRAVVRRLHPDKQAELTHQKTEWWHQAQAAYEAGDAEQLEVILTLCEIDEAGSTERASVSLLQRVIQQFRSSLRQIKNQLARCRQDPAWNFSQRRDIKVMAAQMRQKLDHDLRLLKEEMRLMEQQLAAWAAQSQRQRFATYRRRRYAGPFGDPFGLFS